MERPYRTRDCKYTDPEKVPSLESNFLQERLTNRFSFGREVNDRIPRRTNRISIMNGLQIFLKLKINLRINKMGFDLK